MSQNVKMNKRPKPPTTDAKPPRPLTPARALTKSMNILGHRPLSRKALGERLKKDGADETVMTQTLDKLESLGILNDRQLAEAVVRSELLGKPTGARLLQFKLRRKGIPDALAAQVVSAAVGADAPEDAKEKALEKALSFARSRLRSMTRLEPVARKRRLYAAMARRGLGPEVIDKVMREVKAELAAPGSAGL